MDTCSFVLNGPILFLFFLSIRWGYSEEAECSSGDPTSSHDLRKWEWGAHRDGQHATKRREQTTSGHRQAPGPHTCHRRLCHPGRSWAVSRVCKCSISAILADKHDKQPKASTVSSVHACRELSAGKHIPSVTASNDIVQLLFDSLVNYREMRPCEWERIQMEEGNEQRSVVSSFNQGH